MEESNQLSAALPALGSVPLAGCPSRVVLDHVMSKWGFLVLVALAGRTLRWGELRRTVEGVSEKMLAQTLQTLERDGLVHREVYREVPPKVEYSLTAMGRSLEPLLRFMSNWGHDNRARLVSAVAHAAGAGMADLAAD